MFHIKKQQEKKTNDKIEKNTGEEIRRRSQKTFAETSKRNLEENLASSTSNLKRSFHWKRILNSSCCVLPKKWGHRKNLRQNLKEKQIENLSKSQQDLSYYYRVATAANTPPTGGNTTACTTTSATGSHTTTTSKCIFVGIIKV